MKKLLCVLFLIASPAFAQQSATMLWDAVTEAVDGSALTVDGYRVYVSQTSGRYTTPIATVTEPTYTQRFPIGKYFAVVSAFKAGVESAQSNEIAFESKQLAPAVPVGFKVSVK